MSSETLILAFKKQNTDIKVLHLMCSYHEIQPNGKAHELFKVYFKYEYICLFLSVSVSQTHMNKCILVSFYLFLLLSFYCAFLYLTDSDFSLLNPLESEAEPLLSLHISVLLHVLKGSCLEKQCMALFQLRKQTSISLARRGNQMCNLCSRVNHTLLRKYTEQNALTCNTLNLTYSFSSPLASHSAEKLTCIQSC